MLDALQVREVSNIDLGGKEEYLLFISTVSSSVAIVVVRIA